MAEYGHKHTKFGKKYRGVTIYKCWEQITGSDFKILKSGEVKDCKPKFELLGYCWKAGYPNDTVEELKESIDKILDTFDTEEAMKECVEVLNGD
jgi:hypothetical protein